MKDLKVDFPIYADNYTTKDVLGIAEDCIKRGAKVIICRGETAARLRVAFDIHVVDIRYTLNDYAMAVQKIGQGARKIAVVGFTELCKLANRKNSYNNVIIRKLKSENELPDTLGSLKRLGVDTVVGGGRTINLAERFGMNGVYIEVDDVSLEQSIKEALHNLKIIVELEKKNEMINLILDSVSEGIMAIDQNGFITHMNPFAKKIFGYTGNNMPKIENIMPMKCVKTTLSGTGITGEIITIRGKNVTISSKPIQVIGNSENIGAVFTFQGADQIQNLENKVRKNLIGKGHVAKARFEDILGKSPEIVKVKEMAKEFARVDSTILILGETGVGKEVFAQSIHNYSDRWQKPFIAINCAAFSPTLLESELFGYVKGAFTGASPQGKLGIFELAHTGTIFLDEIGEMPISLQAKLLRVLQEKEVTRLGDEKLIPVDVRIVSATNKNIFQEIRLGRFREDLYYRLCVLTLTIPPLRERKEDIIELSKAFIERYNKVFSKNIQDLTLDAKEILINMDWNGNVRQLSNLIERSVVISKGSMIDRQIIQSSLNSEGSQTLVDTQNLYKSEPSLISEIEKDLIRKLLIETGGDKLEVAKRLGISPTTLWRRMKKMQNNGI